nr:hypothetical protein [Tanacetum cinerariifolium]
GGVCRAGAGAAAGRAAGGHVFQPLLSRQGRVRLAGARRPRPRGAGATVFRRRRLRADRGFCSPAEPEHPPRHAGPRVGQNGHFAGRFGLAHGQPVGALHLGHLVDDRRKTQRRGRDHAHLRRLSGAARLGQRRATAGALASLHPGMGGNPGFSKYDLDSGMRLVFYPAVIGWTLLGPGRGPAAAPTAAGRRSLRPKPRRRARNGRRPARKRQNLRGGAGARHHRNRAARVPHPPRWQSEPVGKRGGLVSQKRLSLRVQRSNRARVEPERRGRTGAIASLRSQ